MRSGWRVVVRDAPFTVTSHHHHVEACGARNRQPIRHTCEIIEASDNDSIVIDNNGPPLPNSVRLATAHRLQKEVMDRLRPLAKDGAYSPQKDGIRGVYVRDSVEIIGVVGRHPAVD